MVGKNVSRIRQQLEQFFTNSSHLEIKDQSKKPVKSVYRPFEAAVQQKYFLSKLSLCALNPDFRRLIQEEQQKNANHLSPNKGQKNQSKTCTVLPNVTSTTTGSGSLTESGVFRKIVNFNLNKSEKSHNVSEKKDIVFSSMCTSDNNNEQTSEKNAKKSNKFSKKPDLSSISYKVGAKRKKNKSKIETVKKSDYFNNKSAWDDGFESYTPKYSTDSDGNVSSISSDGSVDAKNVGRKSEGVTSGHNNNKKRVTMDSSSASQSTKGSTLNRDSSTNSSMSSASSHLSDKLRPTNKTSSFNPSDIKRSLQSSAKSSRFTDDAGGRSTRSTFLMNDDDDKESNMTDRSSDNKRSLQSRVKSSKFTDDTGRSTRSTFLMNDDDDKESYVTDRSSDNKQSLKSRAKSSKFTNDTGRSTRKTFLMNDDDDKESYVTDRSSATKKSLQSRAKSSKFTDDPGRSTRSTFFTNYDDGKESNVTDRSSSTKRSLQSRAKSSKFTDDPGRSTRSTIFTNVDDGKESNVADRSTNDDFDDRTTRKTSKFSGMSSIPEERQQSSIDQSYLPKESLHFQSLSDVMSGRGPSTSRMSSVYYDNMDESAMKQSTDFPGRDESSRQSSIYSSGFGEEDFGNEGSVTNRQQTGWLSQKMSAMSATPSRQSATPSRQSAATSRQSAATSKLSLAKSSNFLNQPQNKQSLKLMEKSQDYCFDYTNPSKSTGYTHVNPPTALGRRSSEGDTSFDQRKQVYQQVNQPTTRKSTAILRKSLESQRNSSENILRTVRKTRRVKSSSSSITKYKVPNKKMMKQENGDSVIDLMKPRHEHACRLNYSIPRYARELYYGQFANGSNKFNIHNIFNTCNNIIIKKSINQAFIIDSDVNFEETIYEFISTDNLNDINKHKVENNVTKMTNNNQTDDKQKKKSIKIVYYCKNCKSYATVSNIEHLERFRKSYNDKKSTKFWSPIGKSIENRSFSNSYSFRKVSMSEYQPTIIQRKNKFPNELKETDEEAVTIFTGTQANRPSRSKNKIRFVANLDKSEENEYQSTYITGKGPARSVKTKKPSWATNSTSSRPKTNQQRTSDEITNFTSVSQRPSNVMSRAPSARTRQSSLKTNVSRSTYQPSLPKSRVSTATYESIYTKLQPLKCCVTTTIRNKPMKRNRATHVLRMNSYGIELFAKRRQYLATRSDVYVNGCEPQEKEDACLCQCSMVCCHQAAVQRDVCYEQDMSSNSTGIGRKRSSMLSRYNDKLYQPDECSSLSNNEDEIMDVYSGTSELGCNYYEDTYNDGCSTTATSMDPDGTLQGIEDIGESTTECRRTCQMNRDVVHFCDEVEEEEVAAEEDNDGDRGRCPTVILQQGDAFCDRGKLKKHFCRARFDLPNYHCKTRYGKVNQKINRLLSLNNSNRYSLSFDIDSSAKTTSSQRISKRNYVRKLRNFCNNCLKGKKVFYFNKSKNNNVEKSKKFYCKNCKSEVEAIDSMAMEMDTKNIELGNVYGTVTLRKSKALVTTVVTTTISANKTYPLYTTSEENIEQTAQENQTKSIKKSFVLDDIDQGIPQKAYSRRYFADNLNTKDESTTVLTGLKNDQINEGKKLAFVANVDFRSCMEDGTHLSQSSQTLLNSKQIPSTMYQVLPRKPRNVSEKISSTCTSLCPLRIEQEQKLKTISEENVHSMEPVSYSRAHFQEYVMEIGSAESIDTTSVITASTSLLTISSPGCPSICPIKQLRENANNAESLDKYPHVTSCSDYMDADVAKLTELDLLPECGVYCPLRKKLNSKIGISESLELMNNCSNKCPLLKLMMHIADERRLKGMNDVSSFSETWKIMRSPLVPVTMRGIKEEYCEFI